MDLPAELIDLVYHHALASGYTAILRTSHRVYSEAFKILYKSAFLRIYYEGAVSEERWPVTATHVSADAMTLIQNIDICVNFDPNVGKHNTSSGLLASFSGPDAPLRLACNLKLEGFQPTINLDNVSIILRTMSGLVNFRECT